MRKKGNLIALSVLLTVSSVASATASFAWFVDGNGIEISFGNTNDNYLTGAVEKSLFDSGSGIDEDPYIIKTPVQLYNLAWAYYSGKYDGQYPYFKVANDINMTGYTLPPIGTEDHPFVASFDGNGKTISNLTVSNVYSDYGTAKPSAVTSSNFDAPEVVGFFGAVGPIITNTSYSNYSGTAASLTDLTIKNLTVKSNTDNTLIGLAAGYVDGEMSGVKIDGTTSLTTKDDAQKYNSSVTNNLSDYSLVGYTTNEIGTDGTGTKEISEYYDSNLDPDFGTSAANGGSVDMYNIYGRLLYINSNPKQAKTFSPGTAVGNIIWASQTQSATRHYISGATSSWNETNSSFFPLNVIADGLANGNSNYSNYYPATSTNTNGRMTNTGYIVGAYTHGSTKQGASVRISEYERSKTIVNSTSFSNNQWTINDSAVKTINASGTKNVSEVQSGFELYDSTKTKLKTMLDAGGSNVYGMHFFETNNATDIVNNSAKMTVSNNKISILDKTYYSYELPMYSVDFQLKKKSYVNFFAGSYVGQGDAKGFFSLHQVFRNETTSNGNTISTITAIKQISEIYSDNKANHSYMYKYSDGKFYKPYRFTSGDTKYTLPLTGETVTTYTEDYAMTQTNADLYISQYGYTKVFDTAWIGANTLSQKYLYYFEFGMNQGEFCLGNVSGADCGYLLYLDIGSNGSQNDSLCAYTVKTGFTGYTYPVGVDFAVTGVGTTGGYSFGLAMISGGSLSFAITATEITLTDDNGDSAISAYSFKGTKWSSTSSSGKFTIVESGSSPGTVTETTIVSITTHILLIEFGNDVPIRFYITEDITVTSGQTSYTFVSASMSDGSSTVSYANIAAITSSYPTITATFLASLKELDTIATLASDSDYSTEIDYKYNNTSDYKTLNVAVAESGVTISRASVASGYTVYINGSLTNPITTA